MKSERLIERERERGSDGGRARRREGVLEMLSEDINASMNYSVMTTRSVIKNAANICSVLRGGCGEWASRRGKALKINMTNWQIICSIRTAEQVHPASQAVPHGDTLTSQKPRA